MKLKELIILKEEGKNVAEALNDFYRKEMESEDAYLEFGAVYDDAISYDSDFEELIQLLKVQRIELIYHGKDLGFESNNYIYLYDGEVHVIVPFIDRANRHDEEYPDETFIFFNEIVEITPDKYLTCDECKKLFIRDLLVNLDPVNEEDDEFKEEYKGYDGMVCEGCYMDMCN